MEFRGGESQRGILSLFSGYSEKAHCTGEPPLHAINKGGGRHFRAVDYGKQDQPKTNLLYKETEGCAQFHFLLLCLGFAVKRKQAVTRTINQSINETE
jgi:hypothetical protein